MGCTLTFTFLTPGYGTGSNVRTFDVPDETYLNPYIVPRRDLGYNGTTNNVYSVDCDGRTGTVRLVTNYPGSVQVSIKQNSSINSCNITQSAHDCLNGACISAARYNTPGLYQSLSECEQACGTGCGGKCVSNKSWAAIESLARQLKNQNCS